MNNPGKATSIFMVDEFPTILLQGIDTLSIQEYGNKKTFKDCITAVQIL